MCSLRHDVQEIVLDSNETTKLNLALKTLEANASQNHELENKSEYLRSFRTFFDSIVEILRPVGKEYLVLDASNSLGDELSNLGSKGQKFDFAEARDENIPRRCVEASRTPDILIAKTVFVGGEHRDYVIAGVKLEKGVGEFGQEQKSRLCEYLRYLLKRKQGWMIGAEGILMNRKRVLFIRAEFDESHKLRFAFTKSYCYLNSNLTTIPTGTRRLAWLIQGSRLEDSLRLGMLSRLPKPLGVFLGRGATSFVFASTQSPVTVIKISREGEGDEKIESERQVLEKLSKMPGIDLRHVPILVGESFDPTFIETTPIATHFGFDVRFTGHHALQVLRVLQVVHSSGIVHRDIRPDNLLFHSEGVLVNDWGASIEANVRSPYHGAARHVSDDVLDFLASDDETYVYTVCDDLIGFVRTLCSFFVPEMHLPSQLKDPVLIKSHWAKMPALWKEAEKLAKEQNHVGLQSLLTHAIVTTNQ